MKPPPVVYDQRPTLWTTGAIFGGTGLLLTIFDNPLVPLSHVFHIIPIGIGGAIGCAVLREKYGQYGNAAYLLFGFYMIYAVFTANTTPSILLLSAGVYSLTRAIVQTVAEMEG